MTHPTDAMVEAVARASFEFWARHNGVAVSFKDVSERVREFALNDARAAIAAYEAKLLESGMVITTVEAALNVPVNNGHP